MARLRIPEAPNPDRELEWLQLAQHYGLPTRLLDWTESPAGALFFACLDIADHHGLVFILNPIDLNRAASFGPFGEVLDANLHANRIDQYMTLGVKREYSGLETVAILPSYNSERILLQRGTFTLHGNRRFGLDKDQAPSLVAISILKRYKDSLRSELERVGIHEMSIFPEPEYICRWLKRRIQL